MGRIEIFESEFLFTCLRLVSHTPKSLADFSDGLNAGFGVRCDWGEVEVAASRFEVRSQKVGDVINGAMGRVRGEFVEWNPIETFHGGPDQ